MIRGVYLNTMNDDLSKCMKIYQDVFEEDMNENVETWKILIVKTWRFIFFCIMKTRYRWERPD